MKYVFLNNLFILCLFSYLINNSNNLFAEDYDDNALKAKLPLLSSTSNNQIDITKSPTDKDAPVSIYTIECTGNVIGKVTDKPDEPNIRSGLGIIYMLSDSSYNYEFTYTYFEPGKNSISTNWKLNKINPYSDAKAVLFFIDSKGNSNIQNIKHVHQKLDIDKTKIDFGYVKQNEQKSSTITVVNKTDKQILVDSIYFLNGNNNFTYKTLDWNVKDIIEINGKRQLLVEYKNDSNIKKTEMNVKDNLVISAGCIKLNELKVSALIGTIDNEITDLIFPKVFLQDQIDSKKILRITNKSKYSNWIITNIKGLNNTAFKSNFDFSKINKFNPLIIPVNDFTEIEVLYQPSVVGVDRDSLIFVTEEMLVLDTICYLFGEAVDSTSSIETDFSKEELFTITPSPIISEGNVNILFNEESLISLKLYDNLARKVADVFKGKANVGLNTFGISANKLGLTSGVYYLNLISDNLNLMKQILIIE